MKRFSSKNKFPQSPKTTKKYSSIYNSSKYNGYGSVTNMSTIRILIYAPDKYTLQTRIVSFLDNDHEKSLKEVRIALFMNDNTKNPLMEHCPCLKYGMIYRSDMYNL